VRRWGLSVSLVFEQGVDAALVAEEGFHIPVDVAWLIGAFSGEVNLANDF